MQACTAWQRVLWAYCGLRHLYLKAVVICKSPLLCLLFSPAIQTHISSRDKRILLILLLNADLKKPALWCAHNNCLQISAPKAPFSILNLVAGGVLYSPSCSQKSPWSRVSPHLSNGSAENPQGLLSHAREAHTDKQAKGLINKLMYYILA